MGGTLSLLQTIALLNFRKGLLVTTVVEQLILIEIKQNYDLAELVRNSQVCLIWEILVTLPNYVPS